MKKIIISVENSKYFIDYESRGYKVARNLWLIDSVSGWILYNEKTKKELRGMYKYIEETLVNGYIVSVKINNLDEIKAEVA